MEPAAGGPAVGLVDHDAKDGRRARCPAMVRDVAAVTRAGARATGGDGAGGASASGLAGAASPSLTAVCVC